MLSYISFGGCNRCKTACSIPVTRPPPIKLFQDEDEEKKTFQPYMCQIFYSQTNIRDEQFKKIKKKY